MSEEKTRIIRRTSAAVPTDRPHRSGDKIVFFCPNGDRVIVPASFAGKRGVCSKCKVPVVIPILPVEEPGPVLPADLAEPAADEAPAEESSGAEPPALEPVAGGPDGPDGLVPGAAAPLQPDEAAPEADGWQFVASGTDPHAGLASEPAAVASAAAWIPPLPPVDGGPAAEHPTARLVARLWVERGHGGIVELHMGGGGVILPEWYEPQWSRGTHGLFASQAVDGSVTLTAVAWDKIEKIVVRKVQGLPDGMFE
jgi:hypothetical protein